MFFNKFNSIVFKANCFKNFNVNLSKFTLYNIRTTTQLDSGEQNKRQRGSSSSDNADEKK